MKFVQAVLPSCDVIISRGTPNSYCRPNTSAGRFFYRYSAIKCGPLCRGVTEERGLQTWFSSKNHRGQPVGSTRRQHLILFTGCGLKCSSTCPEIVKICVEFCFVQMELISFLFSFCSLLKLDRLALIVFFSKSVLFKVWQEINDDHTFHEPQSSHFTSRVIWIISPEMNQTILVN